MKLTILPNTLHLCKCPTCGVAVPRVELEEHLARCTGTERPESRRVIRAKLECRCGRSFVSRERIRKHVKQCPTLLTTPLKKCQKCGSTPGVLLQKEELLCPECVLEPAEHRILGARVVCAGVASACAEAIRAAARSLLKLLGAESLEELGIRGVIITPGAPLTWSTPGGVLVLTTGTYGTSLKQLMHRLPGELYLTHLRQECWSIRKPSEPLTLFEARAHELAERVVLTRNALSLGATEVIEGELAAAGELLSTLPPPSREHFLALSCEERFTGLSEVSFRVAQMEHLLSSGIRDRSREKCLHSLRSMQRYVDTGGGAALVALFRASFSMGKTGLSERVENLIRGFDVWAKHEQLGLF